VLGKKKPVQVVTPFISGFDLS